MSGESRLPGSGARRSGRDRSSASTGRRAWYFQVSAWGRTRTKGNGERIGEKVHCAFLRRKKDCPVRSTTRLSSGLRMSAVAERRRLGPLAVAEGDLLLLRDDERQGL